MTDFRRKSLPVEVRRVPAATDLHAWQELIDWLGLGNNWSWRDGSVELFQEEGMHIGQPGDFLIKEPTRQVTACKPKHFDQLFEPLVEIKEAV